MSQVGETPVTYHSRNFRHRIYTHLSGNIEFVRALDPNQPFLLFPAFSSGMALHQITFGQDKMEGTRQETTAVIDPESEILSWLYHVALKVRGDISASPSHNFIGGFKEEHTEKVVTSSLYLLLHLICSKSAENVDELEDTRNRIKTRFLSIAQDIVFLASNGRKKIPKHIVLGVTVHQAARSKKLVQLLHAAGHCISYELVNSLLDVYEANEKSSIPANVAHLNLPGYIRFANDSIDIIEETLDGKGTFHASQSAIFVTPDETNEEASMQVEFSKKVQKIPQELQILKQAGIGSPQPEPVFWKNLDISIFQPQEDVRYLAVVKDTAWLICKAINDKEQHIPAWTGFNQALDEKGKDVPVTIIGHLPIINAPAHDYDVLWTVMGKCMAITEKLGQDFCVLTLDEQLYSKAKLLQWFKKEECEKMILMLGGFHTQMNFAKIIGKHMADSGLKEIWTDSSLFGENTAGRILQGKGWNRVIRAHKLTLEALWRILWPQFKDWLADNGKTIDPRIVECAKNMGRGFSIQDIGMI